jgi:periplasmic protein TonB
MFDNLIESRAKRQKATRATAFSFVFHAVLIGAAVYVTYHADEAFAKPKEEKVDFVTVKKDPPPPKEQPKPPPDVVVAPPPPKGFQILTAPIKIPDVIPQVDLSKEVTREEDFTGKGAEGGTARGVAGGVAAPLNSDQTYFEFQVEKQVSAAEGNTPPTYPSVLRAGNIEGQVLVSFVVDTSGRADMSTFNVIKTTHDLFTAAVKQHLPQMRFIPAEIGGHKVKQLVQMPFIFTLNK